MVPWALGMAREEELGTARDVGCAAPVVVEAGVVLGVVVVLVVVVVVVVVVLVALRDKVEGGLDDLYISLIKRKAEDGEIEDGDGRGDSDCVKR
jgi:hypothetical protein